MGQAIRLRRSEEERLGLIESIRDLAKKDWYIDQIAEELDLRYDYVRLLASSEGIEIKKRDNVGWRPLSRNQGTHGRESLTYGISSDIKSLLMNKSWGSPA